MNKQQLAAKIWESANRMRSKIEANEYKDYILGFIFYKYLSEQEQRFMRQQDVADADMATYLLESEHDTVEYVKSNLGYFIEHKHLFSTWIESGPDFDISNVRDALSAFSRNVADNYKKVFSGVFRTLETGLSKLGESAASQTKSARDLLYLIDEIPMDSKSDYDVLGFIYEYLISNFAANAGKKAGEFYTPHEVSLLMSHIIADHLRDREEIKIYDPTSGSGSLLLNIGRAVAKHMDDADKIKYYAQELKQNTYNLTRMNLVMRGIKPDNIECRNADTLEEDWPYFDEADPTNTYEPLYVDAVVSNPPYSQQWDPQNKESDPRYARFGLAPKSKADYAFLLHDLFHVKPDGIMTIILPHGVLFRGGEEGQIRKNLVEGNHVDAIIGLPANIFYGTGIPTIIMVLRQKRDHTDTLIVDASKCFAKVGKNNMLRASDIRRVVDAVAARQDVPKFARVVSRDEIRANDYNLNIPRYADSSAASESWDVYSSVFGGVPAAELDALSDYWAAFPGLREALFAADSDGYSHLRAEDVSALVREHPSVTAFNDVFVAAFADFPQYLHTELVAGRSGVRVSTLEDVLTADLFARLGGLPLVDPYEAFQLLHDDLASVAVDIEMIQTEGEGVFRRVDPRLVVKKKQGRDVEVQDGWVGRIFPFELVQSVLLSEQAEALSVLGAEGVAAESELQQLLEDLSESDREDLSEVLNDSNDGFVNAAVLKAAKALGKSEPEEDTPEWTLWEAARLISLKKQIDRRLKAESVALEELTVKTIEDLSDKQVEQLLVAKWIDPILRGLESLPESLVKALISRVEALAKKYETTLADLETQIAETERELSGMLDMLTGSETDMKALQELKLLLSGTLV
ncbi:type I restriction-modification system subunit M [Boudabousia marimammalium]|uniref:site-specific DNA-methyltransferase (adenine-specific) n=1 Tax=Boudabousia marimammalium TaxID=156892 RepID=A0A1Q5PJV7_9ACTO|nr:type I restriction-modification system subunit M [Boudabousia marimammalium]OKL46227.1 type I restriction-modification system subunit M [Boudabousia marimammalium]